MSSSRQIFLHGVRVRLSILRGQIIHRAAVHADGTSRHIFDLFLREFGIVHPRFVKRKRALGDAFIACLLYTSPSPRDRTRSRMPSSA